MLGGMYTQNTTPGKRNTVNTPINTGYTPSPWASYCAPATATGYYAGVFAKVGSLTMGLVLGYYSNAQGNTVAVKVLQSNGKVVRVTPTNTYLGYTNNYRWGCPVNPTVKG